MCLCVCVCVCVVSVTVCVCACSMACSFLSIEDDGAKFYKPGQCTICGDTRDSYPQYVHLTWEELVRIYNQGGEFATGFDFARGRKLQIIFAQQNGDPVPPLAWLPKGVDGHNIIGLRVSSWYKFCDADEYKRAFKIFPLASRIFLLTIEDGCTDVNGVLVKRTPDDPPIVKFMKDVELFRQADNTMTTVQLKPLDALREGEAKDTLAAAHQRLQTEHLQAFCFVANNICFAGGLCSPRHRRYNVSHVSTRCVLCSY